MSWTRSDLARLAYSQACRELGDSARAQVPTVHDGWLRTGELVADALRLRRDAEHVVELAIVCERVKGASWQQIADALQISTGAARERYAPVVQDIRDAILFPSREGRDGAPGWWACPAGVEDPDATARALDAWVARHREPTDPERGDSTVSGGLRSGTDARVLDALGRSLELATRLIAETLPAGVGERTARRMLLEAKVTAYDLIAERERGDRARDARHAAADAFEQLVAWHRGDLRERLGHIATNDHEALITLDGRPLALLTLSGEDADEDARGWYLWWLGKRTNVPLRGPRLPPRLHGALLAAARVGDGDELVADIDSDVDAAIGRALEVVCEHAATDAANAARPSAGDRDATPSTTAPSADADGERS